MFFAHFSPCPHYWNEEGLEEAQTKAVIIPFDNALSLFGGNPIVNTRPSRPRFDPVILNLTITFEEPIPASLVSNAPFNPFLFADGDRTREIHLRNYSPTDLAGSTFFNAADDNTDFAISKTYSNPSNIPWAINLIHNFRFPTEETRIDQAYNYFVPWGQSKGLSYSDWYKDNNGYRNVQKIIFMD